ncbi:DUF6723 family protein [Caballeronia sp. LZ029]|uniref:DUF6723 family protein n=1 Tax=Caballeronia sp. LZ029 TaxID=3038564 RepID=UPI00286BAD0E|nr:DUF6723 family protein [Caballeronia sp. LZ029]
MYLLCLIAHTMANRTRRAKVVIFPNRLAVAPKAGAHEDDYAVYASYRPSSGRFVGTLKVVRLTDARMLYPFDGAEEIGPFESQNEAREAAVKRGTEIVRADLRCPEL